MTATIPTGALAHLPRGPARRQPGLRQQPRRRHADRAEPGGLGDARPASGTARGREAAGDLVEHRRHLAGARAVQPVGPPRRDLEQQARPRTPGRGRRCPHRCAADSPRSARRSQVRRAEGLRRPPRTTPADRPGGTRARPGAGRRGSTRRRGRGRPGRTGRSRRGTRRRPGPSAGWTCSSRAPGAGCPSGSAGQGRAERVGDPPRPPGPVRGRTARAAAARLAALSASSAPVRRLSAGGVEAAGVQLGERLGGPRGPPRTPPRTRGARRPARSAPARGRGCCRGPRSAPAAARAPRRGAGRSRRPPPGRAAGPGGRRRPAPRPAPGTAWRRAVQRPRAAPPSGPRVAEAQPVADHAPVARLVPDGLGDDVPQLPVGRHVVDRRAADSRAAARAGCSDGAITASRCGSCGSTGNAWTVGPDRPSAPRHLEE